MDKVQINTIDRGLEVGKTVDSILVLLPVIVLRPISTKLFKIIQIDAVIPPAIIGHFMPRILRNPRLDMCYRFVGDIYIKRFYRRHTGLSKLATVLLCIGRLVS